MAKKLEMTFQEREVAKAKIDKLIPDAINAQMPAICKKLGIPDAELLIALNTPNYGAVTVALDANDIAQYTPIFGSAAEQQATVMGALVGAGHAGGVFKMNPARQDDGSYVFESIDDLARCVESLASGRVVQADGKYSHIIKAGPKAPIGSPTR